MGKQRAYRVWQSEEEEALRLGVQKHGLGAWELIRTDEAFPSLHGRTGVQLKDKWRNLVKFKHLTQAETACLATKTQKETWRRDDQYGYDPEEQQDYSNFGSGPLPSVAVCCQQEIHATLLAREAHNIQIEANRALSAALAGIDRDVEGADELMRNSVLVANQASVKAMKAKKHVVLARRRLAMALLAAERDGADERVGAHGKTASGNTAGSPSCSHDSSHENVQKRRNSRGGSEDSEAGTSTELDKLDNASSCSIFSCPCGTQLKEGMPICMCKTCGSAAHEDCLAMEATTEGKTFSKPYMCKSCKAKDAEAQASPSDSEQAEDAVEDLQLPSAESNKRKAPEDEPRQEKRTKPDVMNVLRTLLGDKFGEFQAVLQQSGLLAQGGNQLAAQLAGSFGAPATVSPKPAEPENKAGAIDSIASALSFSVVKAPQTSIPILRNHDTISESTLLDNVLQDMSDLDATVGLSW